MLVGYARVSTRDQNLDMQIRSLTDIGCSRIFTEQASGARRDRPELKAALDYMRPKDTLVVWKFDRLARSLKQLIETIESLDKNQIGLRSLTEEIDTTSAGGRLVFHVFSSLAEFERGLIKERTLAGLAAAAHLGRFGGRPPALKDEDLEVIKTLLLNPNITVAEIAKRMKINPSTLYRHLPGGKSSLFNTK
jgi:DNA invertase Pin-like site-specific DNA recombinase